ncbi:unnamed protein product [Bursaphelenchus xylophilus]|uniref:(pine wood nematode) hypothetical protein n=1 Tax=Bursaphelenchus xylophilus TaxID=6326 RepID=A0A1I7RIQ5_BURXY|nr:unnamed protein product [Bursaphelenchus xylophilus]CAG9119018.1 unnamed protein product [Bursaphelenchus xylophilus]
MFAALLKPFRDPNWRSVLGAVIFGAMIAVTIHDSYLLWERYWQEPKESDMKIEVNETMPIPDITFCVPSVQATSHFSKAAKETDLKEIEKYLSRMKTKDDFLGKKWGEKLLYSAYTAVAALHTLEREAFGSFLAKQIKQFGNSPSKFFSEKRNNVKFWTSQLETRNVTFEELKKKVGSDIIDIMVRGEFQRLYHNKTEVTSDQIEAETTWISEKDFCFKAVLNETTGAPVTHQNAFLFLNYFQNEKNLPKEDQVKCASMNFHGDPYDISPYSEHGGSSRDGITESICPGLRYDVTVEVLDVYTMVENDEEGTKCQEIGDDDGEEEKTVFECHGICRAALIKDICNCTAMSTQHLLDAGEDDDLPLCGDYSQCDVDVQQFKSREGECADNCKRDCKQTRFQIISGQTARIVHPLSNGEKVKSNAMTTVFVSWASFEYMTVEQEKVYKSWSAFIGELGGILGLWLGLSILGIIQDSFTAAEQVTTKAVTRIGQGNKVAPTNP